MYIMIKLLGFLHTTQKKRNNTLNLNIITWFITRKKKLRISTLIFPNL
jgi:hypothetical protein